MMIDMTATSMVVRKLRDSVIVEGMRLVGRTLAMVSHNSYDSLFMSCRIDALVSL